MAQLLREAAEAIRVDWEGATARDSRDGYTLLKVADWLDEAADDCDAGAIDLVADPDHPALAVARAYLGRES